MIIDLRAAVLLSTESREELNPRVDLKAMAIIWTVLEAPP